MAPLLVSYARRFLNIPRSATLLRKKPTPTPSRGVDHAQCQQHHHIAPYCMQRQPKQVDAVDRFGTPGGRNAVRDGAHPAR